MPPFRSEKQRKFFEAIAHGMKPKGGKGPSKAVARKFIQDSKREGHAKGGKIKKFARDVGREISDHPTEIGLAGALGTVGAYNIAKRKAENKRELEEYLRDPAAWEKRHAAPDSEGYAQGGLAGFPAGGLGALAGRGRARPSLASNRGATAVLGPVSRSPIAAATPPGAKRTAARGALSLGAKTALPSTGNAVLGVLPGRGANPHLAMGGQRVRSARDRVKSPFTGYQQPVKVSPSGR